MLAQIIGAQEFLLRKSKGRFDTGIVKRFRKNVLMKKRVSNFILSCKIMALWS